MLKFGVPMQRCCGGRKMVVKCAGENAWVLHEGARMGRY